MDIFKFNNPNHPLKMEDGEILNGFESKLWIERYNETGEFSLRAKTSTGMKTKLPIGSFISHIDTTEVMVVENHEISDGHSRNSDIIISGRGFESFFENRIVGSNQSFPVVGPLSDFILAPDYTWIQAIDLVARHVLDGFLINDDNAIPWMQLTYTVPGVGEAIQRLIKRGSLYSRLLELLAVDNLGIKVVRPGEWEATELLTIVFHVGTDRTNEIIFSHDAGEIETADYLWSIKKLKNAALVSGRWIETVVLGPEVEINRRMMFIDASDIDNAYSEPPTGIDLSNVVFALEQRGNQILASQNNVAITNVEISRNNLGAKYRTDFEVGDLITVIGDYNETASMRISEYVEIEDETGNSGYPTLTVV